jgi:peptidyl-tRNA hydrolase
VNDGLSMNARREASQFEESQAQSINQVIVMRHDLKMRRGKQITQGAQASLSFLTRRLQSQSAINLAKSSANV